MGNAKGKEPIYRMERKGNKLYRQLYYYDETINGYRKSKFPKLVNSAKIVSEKPTPKKTPTRPIQKRIQSPRPPVRQQVQPTRQVDPRVKYSSLARSGASQSLINEYVTLGRR